MEQIQCFQAVADLGSFTQAAQYLNKAKSAVMYSVKNLEGQLGFDLFDREHYRPKITPKGEAFLYSSKKIVDDMKELHDKTSLIASEVEMRIRLSASGIFDSNVLYPVLKEAMSVFPSTEVIFEKEILSGEKMLARDMVDLAIFENVHNKRDFDYKHISTVELKLVIAKNHQFFDLPKKEQKKQSLYRYPQVIQRSTIRDDDFTVGVHEDALKWRVIDTASKREIIANGLGWGRLPYHTIEADLKRGSITHLKDLKDDDSVDIYICKKKSRPMGKVAQFIWDKF